ncbi:hypothetical protein RRSWK_02873 [Rhodopirellula sp. SWK7]|nr:hypothetical protein RRSWK_02873 [Rhodopirellula sp. SWK7]
MKLAATPLPALRRIALFDNHPHSTKCETWTTHESFNKIRDQIAQADLSLPGEPSVGNSLPRCSSAEP